MTARKAEVIYVGDAASIVRASQQAEGAAGKTAKGIGSANERISSSTKRTTGETIGFHKKIAGSFVNVTKRAGEAAVGIAAAYASFEGAKKSVEAVSSLTEATIKLTKTTGLSTQAASAYAAVAEVNGISNQKLSQSFGTLAKNADSATTQNIKQTKAMITLGAAHGTAAQKLALITKGAGTQADAFKRLGLTQDDLLRGGKNFQSLLQAVSDKFAAMPGGVEKTALGMKLFGRGWQTLVPLMKSGELGLNAQLKAAKEMGATLGGKTVKSLEQYQAAQNKAKYATLGVQLAVGQYLAPALTKAITVVAGFVEGIRKGTGAGGQFRDAIVDAFKKVKTVLGPVIALVESQLPGAFDKVKSAVAATITEIQSIVGWFKQHQTVAVVLAGALGGVATAFAAVTIATQAWTIATGALDAVLAINPLVAIGVAVAALIGGLVALELKTHFVETAWKAVKVAFAAVVGWIGGAATKAFGIVKTAAEVGLLGPVGLVISHWSTLKSFFSGVVAAIGGAIRTVLVPAFQAIPGIITGVFGTIKTGVGHVLSFVLGGFSTMIGVLKSFFDAVNIKLPIVGHVFGAAGSAISKALGKAQDGIDNFRQQFDPTTKAAQDSTSAIAKAHEDMARRVNAALAGTTAATGKGLSKIDDELASEMRKIGIPIGTIIKVAGAQAGSAITGVGSRVGKAGGGLLQIGSPGEAGRDSVPLNVGGMPIAVAPGEQVAVFNRHQLPVVNAALGKMGGLSGLFSKVKKPNYMAKGGVVGNVSQFDHQYPQHPTGTPGATLTPTQVAQIAQWAGLPGVTFSQIAHGESGYEPGVVQAGQPYSTTGWGMWQITPGNSVPQVGTDSALLNPLVNARAAKYKFDRQGIGAWFGTKFLTNPHASYTGGQLAGTIGAQVAKIKAPKWTGTGGALGLIGSGVLNLAAKGANRVLSNAVAGMGGGGGGGGSFNSGQLGMFDGLNVARWIIPELLYAQSHGWHGRITSGYRAGFDPHAPSGSEHALDVFPGGAVDFGGMVDPAGAANRAAFLAAAAGYPGVHKLRLPVGFRDDGHMSGTGHARGGLLPYVGAFKNGGTVGQTGMALVHKDETITPAGNSLLYPLDAAIAALTAKIAALQTRNPNHDKAIAGLNAELEKIRREKINPPAAHNEAAIAHLKGQLGNLPTPASGKAGDAQRTANTRERKKLEQQISALQKDDKASVADRRKKLANETLTIEQKIKQLKGDDSAAKAALSVQIKNITVQAAQLTQLNTYKTTIAGIKSQVKDLASQAAQAWNALQQTKINATHDASVAAINNGPLAKRLAALQGQDAAEQNANTIASNNQNLSDAQTALLAAQNLVTNSGGQAHLDAVAALPAAQKAVNDAQQAITDYARSQDEQRLQDQITTATSAADATQQTALAGLDKQTADYQASLDAQFGFLTAALTARKITYAQWAKDVNGILSSYGLSVATDPTTEATVSAGPGPGGKKPTILATVKKNHPNWFPTQHRAGGGPVMPGYVYRVGENGPEDVAFGQRGTVMTAAQTRARGGGDVHIHGNLNVNSHRAAKTMADRLAFQARIGSA